MNIFDQIDQFAKRQSKAAEELMKNLPSVEYGEDGTLSLEEIYFAARKEAYAWRKEQGDDCPNYIRYWTEPNASTFPPHGIRIEPPLGSLMDSLCFTMEACEYNLRSLLEHVKSRGARPYKPLLLFPACRIKPGTFNPMYPNMQPEYEYDWNPAYYDEEANFPKQEVKNQKRK